MKSEINIMGFAVPLELSNTSLSHDYYNRFTSWFIACLGQLSVYPMLSLKARMKESKQSKEIERRNIL